MGENMGLEERLIPLRFFTSLVHFICILLIISNHDDAAASESVEKTNLLAAVWMSVAFMGIEFVGLFGGFTLFYHSSNILYITLHSVGILFVSLFWSLSWPHWSYWFIFLVCSLPSGTIEALNIIKIVVCQTRKY